MPVKPDAIPIIFAHKLLWASKPPRPLSRFQALKHVQSLQSARMRISWTQSHGVYKSTPRADFSAELLLTQPPVNQVFWFRSLAVKKEFIFLIIDLFVSLVFSRSRLPVFSSPPAPVRFPEFDHSPVPTVFLPRFRGSSTKSPTVSPADSLHGPCIPRPLSPENPTAPPTSRPRILHGPSPWRDRFASFPSFLSTDVPKNPEFLSLCYCASAIIKSPTGFCICLSSTAWLFGSLLWFVPPSGFSPEPYLCLITIITQTFKTGCVSSVQRAEKIWLRR